MVRLGSMVADPDDEEAEAQINRLHDRAGLTPDQGVPGAHRTISPTSPTGCGGRAEGAVCRPFVVTIILTVTRIERWLSRSVEWKVSDRELPADDHRRPRRPPVSPGRRED